MVTAREGSAVDAVVSAGNVDVAGTTRIRRTSVTAASLDAIQGDVRDVFH